LKFSSLAAVPLHSEHRAYEFILPKDFRNSHQPNGLRNWLVEKRMIQHRRKFRRFTEDLGGYQG
jgi:hypothetical protein